MNRQTTLELACEMPKNKVEASASLCVGCQAGCDGTGTLEEAKGI